MNVLTLLKKDHDAVRDLFAKFDKADRSDYDRKWGLFDDMRRELMVHSKAEEEIFYPAIKALNDQGRKLIGEALKEHKEMEDWLLQIARLNPADAKFDDRIAALIEDVESHIEQEEGEIFRFAKENCPAEELEEIGIEIEKRKSAIERLLAA